MKNLKLPAFPFSASLYSLIFAFLLLPRFTAGQEALTATEKTDATSFKVENLPPLDTLNAFNPPDPYYEFLWIFSDGNFINKSLQSEVNYQYSTGGAATAAVQTQAIATSIYTGGAPPPRIVVLDTTVTEKAGVSKKASAVKPGLFINLQRNHTRIVPAHTTTWILSVRNNFTQDSSQYLNGNLLLFYDGLIELIATQDGDTLLVPQTDAADNKVFSDFANAGVLNFNGGFSGRSYQVEDPLISEHFKEVFVLPFEKLFPQEERHYFINLANDKDLLDKASEKEKGQVRFLAAGVLSDPPPLNPPLSPQEQERAQQVGLPQSLNNDGILVRDPVEQVTFTLFVGNLLMDVHENSASVSKGHDPNKLTITTCECPAGSEVGQKMLFTVEFENDGAGEVDKVAVKLDLPEGVDPARIPDTLVGSHPRINADDIKIIRGENSVTWELKDLSIQPVADFGAGHPSTYGSISFYAFLEHGVDISVLEGQQACITFSLLGSGNEPVCTPPAEIELLTPADKTYELGDFNCAECTAPPVPTAGGFPLPWWLILLILLVIGIALYYALARRR